MAKNWTVVVAAYWDYDGGATFKTEYVSTFTAQDAATTAIQHSGLNGDTVEAVFVAEGFIPDVLHPSLTGVRLDADTVIVDGQVYRRGV